MLLKIPDCPSTLQSTW